MSSTGPLFSFGLVADVQYSDLVWAYACRHSVTLYLSFHLNLYIHILMDW